MKKFKGKALYQPTGKAAEYAAWAVNYYTGCSNDCDYCYCKRGVLNHVWDNKPNLKKCFRSVEHAARIFCDELYKNIEFLRETGILFSFTTDPMLPETRTLTIVSVNTALFAGVPVTILTKRTDWINDLIYWLNTGIMAKDKQRLAFGFTLTGVDELEPNASSNSQRIEGMKELHKLGFKTWASMEPVINPTTTLQIIQQTKDFCDEYKVGLRSGVKKDYYDPEEMDYFYQSLVLLSKNRKIYLKDSVLDYFHIDREKLPKTFINNK